MAGSSSTAQKRSRAVASLTEEQAQHKRDIDRKAQRAFRQRTKDCIASLEQENARIRETFKGREAELEQQVRVLREQNQALVQSLESILELASTTLGVSCDGSVTTAENHPEVQPLGGSQLRAMNSARLAHSTHTTPAREHSPSAATEFENDHAMENAIASPIGSDVPGVSPAQNSATGSACVFSHQESARPGHAVETSHLPITELLSLQYPVTEGNLQSFLGRDRPEEVSRHQASTTNPLVAEQTLPVDETMHSSNQEHVSEDQPQNTNVVAIPTPSSMATVGHASFIEAGRGYSRYAVHTVVPPFGPSVCPLDDILNNFLGSRRAMLADGVPMEAVVGPTRPSVKKLRNPESSETLHTLEELMAGVLSTYLQVKMPQKMAFFWIMNQTMRWMISRTKESYMYMPSWLRPTATQITVPHAIWITNLPWPGVRDLLIEKPEEYPYETVGKWYTTQVSLNWNFDELDAIEDVGGAETVHSIFEKHLRDLKNWTVSPAFLERFPAMGPLIHG